MSTCWTSRVPSLYVHVPFCRNKCPYCSFLSGIKPSEENLEQYIDYLYREIKLIKNIYIPANKISTVYIGGGTPSLLSQKQIGRLFEFIYNNFSITGDEITLEANPEDITKKAADSWFIAGINRISLGFQSMQDNVLNILGRKNTVKQNIDSMEILRSKGFNNLSVDLICSIRGERLSTSLSRVLDLHPEHISVYQLSIEEKTLLFQKVKKKEYAPLNDEEYLKTYWDTDEILVNNGYDHYEISNYAKDSGNNKKFAYGKHNMNYWDYGEYIGIGLGASGFIYESSIAGFIKTEPGFHGKRWTNPVNLKDYYSMIDSGVPPRAFTENIGEDTAIKEYLMLGFRKKKGIIAERFSALFNKNLFNLINREKAESLSKYLKFTPEGIHLTRDGINVADFITRKIWDII